MEYHAEENPQTAKAAVCATGSALLAGCIRVECIIIIHQADVGIGRRCRAHLDAHRLQPVVVIVRFLNVRAARARAAVLQHAQRSPPRASDVLRQGHLD